MELCIITTHACYILEILLNNCKILSVMLAPFISYIIVNYNSGKYLETAVRSLIEKTSEDLEIVIVDNNSSDFSLEFLEKVGDKRIKLKRSNENIGFARANNLGAQIAKGKVLFFINPDVKILEPVRTWAKKIYVEKSHKIYVPLLLNEKEETYENCFTIPFVGEFLRSFAGFTHAIWCQGSALMMKKETFEFIGNWPEDYFIYGEDLDFFYMAHKKGVNVEKIDLRIIHYGEKSTSQDWRDFERFKRKEKALLKFYRKYRKLHHYPFIRGYLFIRKVL